MKAQFREANKSGAKFTVVIGEDEALKQTALIKNMSTGEQYECPFDKLGVYEF